MTNIFEQWLFKSNLKSKQICQEITWGICNSERQKEENSKDLQFSERFWKLLEKKQEGPSPTAVTVKKVCSTQKYCKQTHQA